MRIPGVVDGFERDAIGAGIETGQTGSRGGEYLATAPARPNRIRQFTTIAGAGLVGRVLQTGTEIGQLLVELGLGETVLRGAAQFLLDHLNRLGPAFRGCDREHAGLIGQFIAR